MEYEAVKAWLESRNRRLRAKYRALGILGLVLAPVALAAVVGIICLFLRFESIRQPVLRSPTRCFWIALGCVPFLFLANALTPRLDPMKENMQEVYDLSFFGRRALKSRGLVRSIGWILFAGPRLLELAVQSFRNSRAIARQDIEGCAAVLWSLWSSPGKLPFDELQRRIEWLDLDAVLPELKSFTGVLFLQSPPPGLCLSQDLRKDLGALAGA